MILYEIRAELVGGKCRGKTMQITDRYCKMRDDKEDNLLESD